MRLLSLCAVVAVAAQVTAKPIAFSDGTSVMAEYGAGTMQELQIFYEHALTIPWAEVMWISSATSTGNASTLTTRA